MAKFLWQDESDSAIDQKVMAFMAGDDVVLDRELFLFDIQATAAHVRGLGILQGRPDVRLGCRGIALPQGRR